VKVPAWEVTLFGVLVDIGNDDDEEMSQLKSWEFRCDTQAELETWRDAFAFAATCLGQQQQPQQPPQHQASSQFKGRSGGSVVSGGY
jgi:hypothetical protein